MSGYTQKGVPEGYHTMTPGLCVKDSAKAIEFYKKAFGAIELERYEKPGGKIGHAAMKIGDSIFFLGDEFPEMECYSAETIGKTPSSIYLYVENVDEAFNKAVSAGAKVKMPVADMFWGDRYGKLTDPFGHVWGVGTHVKDVSPEEMKKASEAFFAQGAKK